MAQKKYTDGSGVSEIWLNIKNYVYSQLLGKADTSHTHTKSQITDFPTLAAVATSGSYDDLSNKPTIPTKITDLTNDSNFITSAIKEGDYGNARAGWCLLYGDLLIQWGSNIGNSSKFSITFAKPFSNRPLVTVSYGDVVNYNTPCAIVDSSATNTNFEAAHSGSGSWRVDWIAIGRKGY